MKSNPIAASAAVLAMMAATGLTAASATAQTYAPGSAPAAAQAYDTQSQTYQEQQQTYQEQQDAYQRAQGHYQDQKAAYETRRDMYLRDRDAYDAQYGAGAFVRYWRDHPGEYDERYGPGAYERDFGVPADYEGAR